MYCGPPTLIPNPRKRYTTETRPLSDISKTQVRLVRGRAMRDPGFLAREIGNQTKVGEGCVESITSRLRCSLQDGINGGGKWQRPGAQGASSAVGGEVSA